MLTLDEAKKQYDNAQKALRKAQCAVKKANAELARAQKRAESVIIDAFKSQLIDTFDGAPVVCRIYPDKQGKFPDTLEYPYKSDCRFLPTFISGRFFVKGQYVSVPVGKCKEFIILYHGRCPEFANYKTFYPSFSNVEYSTEPVLTEQGDAFKASSKDMPCYTFNHMKSIINHFFNEYIDTTNSLFNKLISHSGKKNQRVWINHIDDYNGKLYSLCISSARMTYYLRIDEYTDGTISFDYMCGEKSNMLIMDAKDSSIDEFKHIFDTLMNAIHLYRENFMRRAEEWFNQYAATPNTLTSNVK